MDFTRQSRVSVLTAAHGTIAVDAPPPIPASPSANPLARLMPIAMLVAAVGMMAVYFTSGSQTMRHPMYAFFPVMMLTSVLGTLVYSRGASRTADLNTERRKYLDYLDTLDQTTAKTADTQRESLRWSHPESRRLWTLAGDARMWERRPDDPDFCVVRVGTGDQPLTTELTAPELGAEDELDPVTVTAMRRLIQERSTVAGAPLVVPLKSLSVLTVEGDVDVARALVRAMICQLVVWHGPDDLTICAVVGAETGTEWDWLKWLPHHQHWFAADEVGPARLVYPSLAHADSGARSHHAVMILDGGDSAGLCLSTDVTIIDIGASLDGIPQELRLHVSTEAVTVHGLDSDKVIAVPDLLSVVQASVCARRLAPYRVAETDRRTAQPLDWLNMMAIDGVDIEKLWATSDDGHIKPVPIGVTQDGTRVALDINEAAHKGIGPHGLCVGATGSGKSELLRTLALGMIVSHPPGVINLILVDFKGGATFLGLERARHVGAVITNLAAEAPLVTRMNDALTGEINRRQQLLRAAGGCADLSEYRRVRAKNPSLAPLPALFILVDEFSELLSQHPEFAELFVAIGRLGRSLGIHLLLASQRLDEGRLRGLETHLSYRICLKTFSAAESRAVLGVTDAYNLPSTPGAAYLKSAEGELVRFQTAFVSGQCRPRRRAHVPKGPARPLVFTASRVGSRVEQVPGDCPQQPDRTVLDTMLDHLAGRGPLAHQVWLPPLTDSPTLDMVTAVAPAMGPSLAISIGVVDNPYEQRRDLLTVDLDGSAGNVAVVGAPRSGKSTAVRTMMLALAQRHAPAAVAFYCLDLGGGVLSSLRHLPHVGSMAGRQDTELCRRTVTMASSVIRKRESTFRRLGIDSMVEYRRRRAAGEAIDDPFGDVFLVVDGWATLRQEYDFLETTITAIAAQGLSFGVHVVVTASRWAELRPALKDQIATRIELRLGDPAESEMDRKRARELSNRPPGRGISASGREFAIALPRWDGNATADGLADSIVVNVQRLRDRWAPGTAPQVQLLPAKIGRDDLAVRTDHRSRVLVGIGERELTPVRIDFAEQSHLLVLGETGCGKTALLRLLCRELIRTNSADEVQLEIVDFRRSLLGVVESDHLGGYVMSPASLTSRVTALVQGLEARMPGEGVTQQQLRTRSWWSGPDVYLVIDDYDLAAGVTGSPLAPLADFLPHAKDLGLHVVVARRSGGAARAMFDPVLAGMRELGCTGLMMSARPDDGVLLGTVRSSPLPPGRGTLITRGDADQLIQVAWTDPP